MPHTSIFTPCGQLRLSNAPSHAQQFYDQLQQLISAADTGNNNQQFDFTQGEHLEAWVYATARGLGRHRHMLERAGNQAYPMRAIELLPLLELDFQLTPGPKDDYVARQKALAAAELISQGARVSNIIAGLKTLMGSDFLAYVPAPAGVGITTFPDQTSPTAPSHFQDVRTPPRLLQLVDPVTTTGSAIWCAYKNLDTTISPMALVPGDVVMVQGENTSQSEKVTVTATAFVPPAGSNATANVAPLGTTWQANTPYSVGQYVTPTAAHANGFFFRSTTGGTSGPTEPTWSAQFGVQVTDSSVSWIAAGASTVFQATFTKAHDVGASVLAGNFPYWWSTQRHSFVVLTNAAAQDRDKRRRVDTFMRRIMRGVSTWGIVGGTPTGGTSGGTVGPTTVNGPMGATPVGTFSYTNS